MRKVTSQDQVNQAKKEVEVLKQRLTNCHLSAMKEMMAQKAQTVVKNVAKQFGKESTQEAKKDNDEEVTFHEPLEYLDEGTRNLVLSIVGQKLLQVKSGNVPKSLWKALTSYFEEQDGAAGGRRRSKHGEFGEDSEDSDDRREREAEMLDKIE